MKYKKSQSSHNRGGFFCTNVGENSATDPDKHCHIVGGFFYQDSRGGYLSTDPGEKYPQTWKSIPNLFALQEALARV